jgi:hypothetical protein
MSKRKVSTRTLQKQQKIQKIKDYLQTVPEGATPKMISLFTGINQATVRGMVGNIQNVEQIPNLRGLYHLVGETGDDAIFSYNFHNLILGVFLPNYQKEAVKQTLSCELTNYEFEIGKESKRATMRISTPKIKGTDYPINISSITLAFALFRELVLKFAQIKVQMKDVTVNSIEFNKDYSNLKLEGVNCITMENLVEQFKVYQKSDKLRAEHKIKIPMNAEELIKLLGIKHE